MVVTPGEWCSEPRAVSPDPIGWVLLLAPLLLRDLRARISLGDRCSMVQPTLLQASS